MKSEVLMKVPVALPITAMLIFMILFVGLSAWALHKNNREKFLAAGQLPLNDSHNQSSNDGNNNG